LGRSSSPPATGSPPSPLTAEPLSIP
jgi:hypothetical protein